MAEERFTVVYTLWFYKIFVNYTTISLPCIHTHTYVWCAPDQNITSQYNWQVHFHNFFLSSSPPPRPGLVGGLAFQMIWSITLSKFANWGTQPLLLMYVCTYSTTYHQLTRASHFFETSLVEGYHSLSFVNMTQKIQMASHVIIRNYTYMHYHTMTSAALFNI